MERVLRFLNRKLGLKAHLNTLKQTIISEWPFVSRLLRRLLTLGRSEAFQIAEVQTTDALHVHYASSSIQPSTKELSDLHLALSQIDYRPKISMIIPTFNTKAHQIRELIDSLKKQIYANWEACIVDDCSSDQELVTYLRSLPESDSRFKVSLQSTRGRIARVSNEALKMADGQLVALVDHDDVLLPNALGEVVLFWAKHPQAQMIYSDLAFIDDSGKVLGTTNKPGWSPEFFLSTCYTTHLRVFTKAILEQIGGFLEKFEAAQDIDLICRVSEATSAIYNLPKCIYLWRISPTSVTAGVAVRPHIIRNTIESYNALLERAGVPFRSIFPGEFRRGGTGAFKVDFSMATGTSTIVQIYPPSTQDDELLIQNLVVESNMTKSFQWIFVPHSLYQRQGLQGRYAEPEMSLIPYRNLGEIDSWLDKISTEFVCYLAGAQRPHDDSWWKEMIGFLKVSRGIGMVCAKLAIVSSGQPAKSWVGMVEEGYERDYDFVEQGLIDGFFVKNPRKPNPFCFATRAEFLRKFDFSLTRDGSQAPQSFAEKLIASGLRLVYNPWSHLEIVLRNPNQQPSALKDWTSK